MLATRSSTGLGTPIISDVLPIGVQGGPTAGRWEKTLNAAGTLEFTLPIDGAGVTPANFAPGQRELHLYRDAGAGETLVWGGHLWVADVKTPWVRFMGAGWYEALRHRQMGDDYYLKDTEQFDAAWGLINYTQTQINGPLGITRASVTASGVERTVVLCAEERNVIADSLEDLASADDGFDFEIDANKVWRVYYPRRGTNRAGTVFLNGATNVQDLVYAVDATQIENEVAGIGTVNDCEPIQYFTASDATSQAAVGLMQGSLTRSELRQDKPLLEAMTRQQLAARKVARSQPVVQLHNLLSSPTPLTGAYDLGDTISLQASWGYASFGPSPFRVVSYAVEFNNLGQEEVSVTLDGAT